MASRLANPSVSRNLSRVYYVHHRANDDDHPLAAPLEHIRRAGALMRDVPIGSSVAPYRFKYGAMGSNTPKLADHHSYTSSPLVSDRIKNAIAPMNIKNLEFVPAQIEYKENVFPHFWLMHPLTELDVVDLSRSAIELDMDGDFIGIQRMSLDGAKLDKIPLEDRLFFRLKHRASLFMWHCSLVHAVMAVNPSGIQFFDAEGYGQSMQFKV